MSIEQSTSTAPATGTDPFLRAVSNQSKLHAEGVADPRADVREPDEEWSGWLRVVSIGLLTVALLASIPALIDGGRRSSTVNLASQLADMPNSVSMPILSPFVDTKVRLVENQSAALWQQDDGLPALRLATPGSGAIAALVNEDGIPVALGIVPPGLEANPDRLLISPVSTALTIAATHPDVLSGTNSDSLGRLAVAARSSAFAALADLVDGATPIASLGQASNDAAEALGTSLTSATASLQPSCQVAEVIAPGVVRCEDATQLQNTNLRAVPVLDALGDFCDVIPPASFEASPAERAALVAMIVDGLPFDTAAASGPIRPGVVNLVSACQGEGTVPTQANADQIAAWRGQTELVDVAMPLSRIIGGTADSMAADLQAVQATAVASDEPADRLTNATLTIRNQDINTALGLNRVTQPTDIELDGLIQSTIARLYE